MNSWIFYMVCFGIALLLWGCASLFYHTTSKGLSDSARHQQSGRFAVAALIAVAPTALAGYFSIDNPGLWMALAVSAAWWITYPLIYHISNRKVSPDYNNYMDIAAGMYLFGLLSSFIYTHDGLPNGGIITIYICILEFAALTVIAAQWIYLIVYRSCVDFNGMQIMQDTNYNEIIEFFRSFSKLATAGVILGIIALMAVCIVVNIIPGSESIEPKWVTFAEICIAAGLTIFIFTGSRSPFRRCGIVELYYDVKEYKKSNLHYTEQQRKRYDSLQVRQLGTPWRRPSTVLMVIGESGARDFMSAFTPMDRETTPWLSQLAASADGHTVLFPNSYASAMHTVPVLTKSLTECSQYNDKTFTESVSIIDIAHKLGYRVHWYSNQGHLGDASTPVSIVAETSDVAKWTRQELNKVQYDMSLIDFLDEIDPTVNNFIVIHLKGSHFNFTNRYPPEYEKWKLKNPDDHTTAYLNSIYYTDSVLEKIYRRFRRDFNLQAMLYFSDHATIPSRRRTPGFTGFGEVRIPMFVWMSDEYAKYHPIPFEALSSNRDRYFTNDLIYELVCGMLDAESDHFDPHESLASPLYRYTRDTLKTFDGRISVAEDTIPTPEPPAQNGTERKI